MHETEIIKKIKDKYGLSKKYIIQCINKKRKNEIAEFIFNEYAKLKK
ncbi:hypothetical protein [Polaribacter tangerinus]|nr:hypothetical protein [Polaribacter tangerinus]